MNDRPGSWIYTAMLVLLGISVALTGSAAAQSADIVVAPDGSEDYTSIQTAIDNANTGDRIRISQGTYSESIDVRKSVDIVAPSGATISPSSGAVSAVALEGGTESRLANLTIEGTNSIGLDARLSTGDWTAKNMKITGFRFGVSTFSSTGDWVIKNSKVENSNSRGIAPETSKGNWTIKSSVIRNISGIGIDAYRIDAGVIKDTVIKNITRSNGDDGQGINIRDTSGDWIIYNVTVKNTEYDGIDAGDTNATYDPVIRDTKVIEPADDGIGIADSKSDFLITRSIVRDAGGEGINADSLGGNITVRNTSVRTADDGIDIEESSGKLFVSNFTVRDTDGDGIDASNATGNATVYNSRFIGVGDKSIDVIDSEGGWQIHESILTGGSEGALDAWDAKRMINASRNYWGAADGPSETFCGSGGAIGGYNVTMYPYYTDSSLTTLSSATTSGTVQISSSCVVPEDISESNEQDLVLTLSQISADNKSDNITITMPENVSVEGVGEPQAIGTPYEVDVTNSGGPIKLEVDPDEPEATVDFVLRVPVELSPNEG